MPKYNGILYTSHFPLLVTERDSEETDHTTATWFSTATQTVPVNMTRGRDRDHR